ncbi:MAG: methyltransferase domain-containing protein [Candidatus Woesebacteria bacterium]|nr:methyltransferase domain-containing protein [Candidatus Woesebacteria bacterium]
MIVEEFKSKYSKRLIVKKIWDWGWKYYVTTGVLTQSGGLINDIWKPVMSNIQCLMSNVLILGLATGTLAKIINKKFKNAKITGIEIDPVMIEIGKKYFDLDKIQNLEILNIDAEKYNPKEIFDLVLVDLYLGDQPPSFLYSLKYLKKLKAMGKLVIVNHLFYDQKKRENAEKLIKKLEKYFKNIKLRRILTNVMIICE